MFDSPIFVTGVPRSGTSLVAGLIHLHGVWGGKMVGPTQDNPKGFFENSALRQNVVKGYLRSIDVDPMGQNPLPDIDTLPPFPGDLAKVVRDTLSKQDKVSGPWFYKDAKLLLTWPIWHRAFPRAKWILIRRDPDSIAESCMRTGFMRAERTFKGWLEWIRKYEDFIVSPMNAPFAREVQYRVVWPAKIFRGNFDEIVRAFTFLGLQWDQSIAEEFLESSAWHQ